MKLLDANVLLYAVNSDAQEHVTAKSWVEAALSAAEPIAFAWIVILAFIRISTRPGLFARPLALARAFEVLEAWLGAPSAQIVHSSDTHLSILRSLLEKSGTGANLTTDAHLAALAIENGAELVSFDRDFARFPGLRTITLTA